MLYCLQFLSTPMPLEDFQKFEERTNKMSDKEVSAEYDKVYNSIITSMEQNAAIPSSLPKSMFQKLDKAYILHLSDIIDYFGCEDGSQGHTEWQIGFEKYSEDVIKALEEKAASSTHDEKDSPDLTLINNQLVNKWRWLTNGILASHIWTTPTQTPLLTQTVIKHFDHLISAVAHAISTVRELLQVVTHVTNICTHFFVQLCCFADPSMRSIIKVTAQRNWIGAFDGMLAGFAYARGANDDQIKLLRATLLQFLLENRRSGLQSLENRITAIKYQEINKTSDQWKEYFTHTGNHFVFLRKYMQKVRSTFKKHTGPRHTFICPDYDETASQTITDIMEFAQTFLANTPLQEWLSPNPSTASHHDNKITEEIMTAFWIGRHDYNNWLAEPDAWALRVKFGNLIATVTEADTWEFADGITEMDTNNDFAQPIGDSDGSAQGYYASSNKHLIGSEAQQLMISQKQCINKITKLVKEHGTIDGGGMPDKLHKKLNSFLKVR
jgi:hypothetical protein